MFDAQTNPPEIPRPLRGLLSSALKARGRLKAYVISLYDQGYTLHQICETCGIGEETLLLWRREERKVRGYSPKGTSRLDAYAAEIEEAYKRGELLRVIADRCQTTVAKISTYAKRRGWPPRGPQGYHGPRVRHDLDQHLPAIRELYEAGMSAEELARRYGVTSVTIRGRARRLGWQRPPSERPEQEELIFQLLQQGLSIRGIHRNTGMNRQWIKETMRRRGWQVLPGAGDELAGAPPRYEEARRPRGIKPRLAPRQDPPRDLDPAAQRDREALKGVALHLEQMGLRVTQVCAACGITAETLRIWRREEGRHRVPPPAGHTWTEDHEAKLREAWFSDDDLSVRALAKRLKLSRWHLNDMAARRGWPQRSLGPKKDSPPTRRNVLPQHHDEVRALWDAGESTTAIGERFGVTGTTVNAYARRHRFPRRPTQRELHEELVFQCFMDGMPLHGISRQLDVPRTFVTGMVKARGWTRRKPTLH